MSDDEPPGERRRFWGMHLIPRPPVLGTESRGLATDMLRWTLLICKMCYRGILTKHNVPPQPTGRVRVMKRRKKPYGEDV